MKPVLDDTHDPGARSWVESANADAADFPIQNLPFGVFRRRGTTDAKIGIAIGDRVLDVAGLVSDGLLKDDASTAAVAGACKSTSLNPLMALGAGPRRALRRRVHSLLRDDASAPDQAAVSRHLAAQADVEMLVPAEIGDYTDFYASIFHATNVGKLFRPDNPLLPNYKYIPIGYHGRASSLVASGTAVRQAIGPDARRRCRARIRSDKGA